MGRVPLKLLPTSSTRLWIVLTVTTVAACAGGPKVVENVDPFKIPPDQFHRTVKVIALADVRIPDGMEEPEPIEEGFEKLIETRLRDAGYTVVYPQQYKAVWERFAAEHGGLVSAESGERDSRAVAEAMTATLAELGAAPKLDAIVIPSVIVVEAPFGAGRAVWDGTWQSIKTGSVVKGFFAGSPEGTLGALSLHVSVVDTAGTLLYEKSGGIEVLSKLEGKEFVLVPRQELFSSKKRMKKAVKIALDPLLH
jgi:hypothetical protein